MNNLKKYENERHIKKIPVRNEIPCEENKQADNAKAAEINFEDAADVESAYDDSFDSDQSDEESEMKTIQEFPKSEIPLYRFTNSRTCIKNKNVVTSIETVSVASKGSKRSSLTLEEKMSSLDLNGVRPLRSSTMLPPRKNMSFTNNEVMKIERDNELLLRKIMAQQKTKKGKVNVTPQRLSSSAINRKKSQRKIEEDNMVLLQRLQKAKSCALNTNKIPGFRVTHL